MSDAVTSAGKDMEADHQYIVHLSSVPDSLTHGQDNKMNLK